MFLCFLKGNIENLKNFKYRKHKTRDNLFFYLSGAIFFSIFTCFFHEVSEVDAQYNSQHI